MLRKKRKPEITNSIFHANTEPFFQLLVNLGYTPKHIVDVGAHLGGWTRSAINVFPHSKYTLFEPQRELLEGQSDFERPNIRRNYLGVGPVSGKALLSHHGRADSFTFSLTAEQARERGFPQVPAEVIALDDYFERNNEWPTPDILKIDAEGWDIEVIRGAEKVIEGCDVVLVEAGVLNKRFTNTALEVMKVMDSLGMKLFDITDLNRTPTAGALWNVEFAFVRHGGALDVTVSNYS